MLYVQSGRRSRLWGAAVVGCAMAASLAVASPASASTVDDFEAVPIGGSPTGWTKILSRVELGVTTIAACTSSDTSDYLALRDYYSEADPLGPVDGMGTLGSDHSGLGASYKAMVGQDGSTQVTIASHPIWIGGSSPYLFMGPSSASAVGTDGNVGTYTVKVVDGTGYGRSGNVLELFSEVNRNVYGYVEHGPVIVTPKLTVGAGGATFTFDWAAQGGGDDYNVLGYLVDTATCAQTELLDSTGDTSAWQTVSVSVPAGEYRFVFVSGTYDYSWGGYAGARLFIDDMDCAGDCVVEQVASTSGISSSDWIVDFEALKAKVAAANGYPGEPLEEGICSEPVRKVQAVVGATQDGCFGPITARRVIAWKSSHGLDPSAIVDQPTWNAMFG